jgi:hypothetical protein
MKISEGLKKFGAVLAIISLVFSLTPANFVHADSYNESNQREEEGHNDDRHEEREITVTPYAKTKVYGQKDPVFTYHITHGKLEHGDKLEGSLSRLSGENDGTYRITIGSLRAHGYDIKLETSYLTITEKPITVYPNAVEKVYGDKDPSFTYSLDAGALVNGDELTGALDRYAGENDGTYLITHGTLYNCNYNLTIAPAYLTIKKMPITVTADAKSKFVGESDPEFTYQVTKGALINGDVLDVTITRDAGETAGDYALKFNLKPFSNYSVTYVPANLTIKTVPVVPPTIETFVNPTVVVVTPTTTGAPLLASSAVLGATTAPQAPQEDTTVAPEVKDVKGSAKKVEEADKGTNEQPKYFGVNWFWWVLLIALGGLGFWLLLAYRRRNEDK